MPHRDYLSPDYYVPLIFNGVRIGVILLLAYLGTALTSRSIVALRKYAVKMMHRSGGATQFELEKRADTLGSVLRKSLVGVIWTVALIMVLRELNFDIRPLLAGAGLVGVAVGFGAQSVIKDLLAGFFLLIENQMRVNDVVMIDGTGGLVEEINLRTTSLRSEDGALHIFPNGSIQKLSNLTRDFAYYVFSISVDYKDDIDRVTGLLSEIASGMMEEEPYKTAILAPLEVMGVDKLGDSAAVVKARLKTLPMKQWLVGREMNRRIKMRFSETGIALPFPAQTIYLKFLDGLEQREELKQIVREVLSEARAAKS